MKFIALLRGINVGGNNKVSMIELKKWFVAAGFKNVATYINSGNVLFDSDESDIITLITICSAFLESELGYPVGLAIFSAEALREALEHAPHWWCEDPESKHNVIFIIPPATPDEISTDVGTAKPEYEKVEAYGNFIFWSAPLKTFSRTRWSKIVGTKAYQSVTIRNANTAKKLAELSL
jgi:Uncharacterized protein conserved in bacteria